MFRLWKLQLMTAARVRAMHTLWITVIRIMDIGIHLLLPGAGAAAGAAGVGVAGGVGPFGAAALCSSIQMAIAILTITSTVILITLIITVFTTITSTETLHGTAIMGRGTAITAPVETGTETM